MMRRPEGKDGILIPQLFAFGLVGLPAGWLIQRTATTPTGVQAGWWVFAFAATVLLTACLVGWRVLHGAVAAAGCWTVFAAAVLLALPRGMAARHAAPLVIAAGVLLLGTLLAAAALRGLGVMVAAGCWLLWAAWLLHALPGGGAVQAWWPGGLAAGVLVLAASVFVVVRNRGGSQGLVNRWGNRQRRNDGVASRWQVWRTAGRHAVRAKMPVLKPSTRGLSRWQHRSVPTTQVATRIARVGRLAVWVTVEQVTVRFGGPRMGKTVEIAGRILDAPGAVITTSTRTDLCEMTRGVRGKVGPIYVFNPSGMGEGLESTITFDPIQGCADPKTATDRAGDLVAAVSSPGRDDGNREFWSAQARRVLAALLHAAALGGRGMSDVLAWVADSDGDQTKREVQRYLSRSTVPSFEQDAIQFLTTNANTRTSITSTIMPALGWLTDPTAAAAATGGAFDVEQLLADRGTVYLLGAEDAQTAPLVTALTAHIAREARRIARKQPAGRLDPSLTLVLDEAAIICPVPLDKWTADMGGNNIAIHAAVQSWAQLRQRFGDAGAATIVNNTSTLLVFGGTRDPQDLAAYVTLAGEREETVATYDHVQRKSSTTTRKVPVLSAAQIAQLPPLHVMIVRSGMPVALGKIEPAYRRRDVRRAHAEANGIAPLHVPAGWAPGWPRGRSPRPGGYSAGAASTGS